MILFSLRSQAQRLGLCLGAGLLALSLPACSGPRSVRLLATAQVAADFKTYPLRRIGLLPIDPVSTLAGEDYDAAINAAAYAQFSRSTPYELVQLGRADLLELDLGEPIRRGTYQLPALAELARQSSLDGLLWIHLTGQKLYPPLLLDLSAELVALETGQVIWTSAVHLDAGDPAVREGLEAYYKKASDSGEVWTVSLLSPQRFANFGLWQLAQML